MQLGWVLAISGLLVQTNAARRHYTNPHHHGSKSGASSAEAAVTYSDTTIPRENTRETDKYAVIDSQTGIHYNPYSKHHPGRHVCTNNRNVSHPVKTKQAYCKPIYKKYVVKCNGYQLCSGVRLVYETHYKDVVTTRSVNEVSHTCCPGWTQVTNRSHGCNKPTCSKPCLNGGKCVKPDVCSCPKGFSGSQCEKDLNLYVCKQPCLNGGKCLNKICKCLKGYSGGACEHNLQKPRCSNGCFNGGICVRDETCKCPAGFRGSSCELDIDECKEMKPCDHMCFNSMGSYRCKCKETFVLQSDGESCRKENVEDETSFEAKDLEFEFLDRRIYKLESMMDETQKNDVTKTDIQSIYKEIDFISKDIHILKNKITDMENYKSDLHVFKNKLSSIEKKAEKIDDIVVKYDRIRKCAANKNYCI